MSKKRQPRKKTEQPEQIQVTLSYRYKAIQVVNFNISHPGIQIDQKGIFGFDLGVEPKMEIDNNLLYIRVNINIYQTLEKRIDLGSISVLNTFEVFQLRYILNEEGNGIREEQAQMFIAIALSTTRGVLWAHTKGTILHHAILPIIFLDQLKPNELPK
jgi:predicted HTH domain antitoxin